MDTLRDFWRIHHDQLEAKLRVDFTEYLPQQLELGQYNRYIQSSSH